MAASLLSGGPRELRHSFVRAIKFLIYRGRVAEGRALARLVFPALRPGQIARRLASLRGADRTVFVLDPSLSDGSGHHLNFNLAIQRDVAARPGVRSVFVGRLDMADELVEQLTGLPLFVKGAFRASEGRSNTGAGFTAQKGRTKPHTAPRWNELTGQLLAGIDPSELRPDDLVVAHSFTRDSAGAIASWLRAVAARGSKVIAYFMFPDYRDGEGVGPEYSELLDALRAFGPEQRIVLAETVEIRDDLIRLCGPELPVQLAPHFKPEALLEGARRIKLDEPIEPSSGPPCVGYVGHCRHDRGSHLVAEIVREARARAPRAAQYRVHSQNPESGAIDLASLSGLDDVELLRGNLEIEDYYHLLSGIDIMLFPYVSGPRTKFMGSGIFWECVALGIVMVVPSGSNLEAEARRIGAACIGYPTASEAEAAEGGDPGTIAAAALEAVEGLSELRASGLEAGGKWLEGSRLSTLMSRVLG